MFTGSSLRKHLPALAEYRLDVEVCPVAYSRLCSRWKEQTVEEGTLDAV